MRAKKKKICMLLPNSLDYDTRVLNEAYALAKSYDLTILVPNDSKVKLGEIPFKVKKVNFWRSKINLFRLASIIIVLAKIALKEDPDVFHGHDLPGLLAAWPAAVLKKKTLIYDSHELWSDLPNFNNIRGLKWFFPLAEKLAMANVSKGITVNQSIAEHLTKQYGKEFLSLRNVPSILDRQKNKFSLRKQFPGDTIVLHLGSTGQWRGAEELITAAKYLPAGYVIVFVGAGRQEKKLSQMIDMLKLDQKVFLIPKVPPEEVLNTAAEADLGVTLTQKVSLSYYYSLPNKLFQYIGAQIPILGSNFPEFKRIITREKIGEVVDPSKPKDIAKKIIQIAEAKNQVFYRENLKGLAKQKYCWQIESKKLLKFYQELE